MTQDATSETSDTTTATATEAAGDDTTQVEQMLADAVNSTPENDARDEQPAETSDAKSKVESKYDQLGESGKRALSSERKARRDAEKQLKELTARLREFEDRDKTDLEKAVERAQLAERDLAGARTATARLMAAAMHDIPVDMIDLLGDGTEEEIEARAKLIAEKLKAVQAPAESKRSAPAPTRPVESLIPGARPANATPDDPNDAFRQFVNSRRT